MADNSKIEWTDATWNPVRAITADGRRGTHCEHVSEGCRNCYAETFNRRGLPGAGTGLDYKPGYRDQLRHVLDEKLLLAPLRRKKPTRYFLSSLTDVFGAWVTDDMLDRLFAVMALCPQHVFQVLTKRPERARAYLSAHDVSQAGDRITKCAFDVNNSVRGYRGSGGSATWPLSNVWLGTSVEDQAAADARIPHLLATPAAVRFLSCEPLLGAVDLTSLPGTRDGDRSLLWNVLEPSLRWADPAKGRISLDNTPKPRIDWVIVGGESGKGARPMHPGWARGLRDQCAAAGVPFFFKQWGQWAPSRADLIPIPRERQGWVYHDTGATIRPKVEADLDKIEREESRAGRPLYGHVLNVGKKAAGRVLDGIEHNGMPA